MRKKGTADMSSIKSHLKKAIPDAVLALRQRYLERKMNKFLRHAHPKDIFTKIYERSIWGQSDDRGERYYSGDGSHKAEAVDNYVSAVVNVLLSLDRKPDAVDLGCGDFAVGSRISPFCGRYIACDIVDGLIIRNRARYARSDVEFRAVDIVNDDLPNGDVVFIRQVFQHLSNSDIQKVTAKLLAKYSLIILSEHLPLSDKFVPNIDKPTGPKTEESVSGKLAVG